MIDKLGDFGGGFFIEIRCEGSIIENHINKRKNNRGGELIIIRILPKASRVIQ